MHLARQKRAIEKLEPQIKIKRYTAMLINKDAIEVEMALKQAFANPSIKVSLEQAQSPEEFGQRLIDFAATVEVQLKKEVVSAYLEYCLKLNSENVNSTSASQEADSVAGIVSRTCPGAITTICIITAECWGSIC